MLPAFVFDGLIFCGVVLGVGWPIAARLSLTPAEKILATAALSLLGGFVFSWLVYVLALPPAALSLLSFVAALGLAFHRRSLAAALRDPAARTLVTAQLLVTAWCVGWLALVVTYAGGWVGDWFSHWERTRFFLERWPRETLFYGFDPVASRPPMANVLTGALLAPSGPTFAGYQLIMTLLGSLAFMPAALLARRFAAPGGSDPEPGASRVMVILALLFMVNPLFLQNATFAWTKLPSAFFVLAALYFFLRAHDTDVPAVSAVLCAALLAGGILVHYSAGPYALLLAVAWIGLGWRQRRDAAWWRVTLRAGAVGGLLLALWFGWALAVYGTKGALLSNSSVMDQAPTAREQAMRMILNLRDTFVPHFLRPVDFSPFAQASAWGWWNDKFFHFYQTTLPGGFGSLAFFALLVLAIRCVRQPVPLRWFWISFVTGSIALGVATVASRNELGLAHICLQPLVLLGLAFLAARWSTLPHRWRLALVAGATTDFCLGIALHFGIESRLLDHWLLPGRSEPATLLSYSQFSIMNLRAKLIHQWIFFGDAFAPYSVWVLLALAFIFALTLRRARRPAETAALAAGPPAGESWAEPKRG